MPEAGLFEAMHTQRAIRKYLPDPVPDEMIYKVLDAAIRAPSATNSQHSRFVIVRDAELRGRICDYYKKAQVESWESQKDWLATKDQRIVDAAEAFAGHIREVPVLVLVCSVEPGVHHSVLPAAQNLMVAARALGLGTILTTLHRAYEKEIKELVGIPSEVELMVIIPMGWPAVRFGPVRRKPVEEVTFYDRWGKAKA